MRVCAPVYYPVDQFTLGPPLPAWIANRISRLRCSAEQRERSHPRSISVSGNDREIIRVAHAAGHVPDAHRTTSRDARSSSSGSSGYPTVVRENPVDPSVRPSDWDPDARRICPPTERGGGFSCPSHVSSFSFATLSSTPATFTLSPRPNSPRILLLGLFSPSYVRSRSPLRPLLYQRRTVVIPPALPPSSASSSCRYGYHYHGPRHYHRRDGVDDASSSTFSWPSPPAESTWWVPHHLGDPAPLSTNDQRLSLLRGANHAPRQLLQPLASSLWEPLSYLPLCQLRSCNLVGGARCRKPLDFVSCARVNNETHRLLDRYLLSQEPPHLDVAFHSYLGAPVIVMTPSHNTLQSFSMNETQTGYLKSMSTGITIGIPRVPYCNFDFVSNLFLNL